MCSKYIFTNDACKEIRINLKQHKDLETNKMKSNKEVSKHFKTDGWRWKMMKNNPVTKIRSIIYAKQRPDDIQVPSYKRQVEPIVISGFTLLATEEV